MVDPILTGESARILEVSERVVRRYADEGRLRTIRTSRGIRVYERSDVERLARDRAERRRAQRLGPRP